MPMVAWVGSHLDGNGCLVASWDPYTSWTGSDVGQTGETVGASFFVSGDQTSLTTANNTLNCAVADYQNPSSPIQKVFAAGGPNTAMLWLANAPGMNMAAWRNAMNVLPSGNNIGNQRVAADTGVWMGHVIGLTAYTNAASIIDGDWNFGAGCTYCLGSRQSAPWYLFEDLSSSPDTFSVEGVGRDGWLGILANGFNGSTQPAMSNAQKIGTLTKMLIQGPTGDVAPNGRTDNHNWVEAADQGGYEIMAQLTGASNPFLAGQFQRAAEMTFNGIGRFVNPNCCNSSMFFITKNHYDPALRVSYQTASSGEYNLSLMSGMAGAYVQRSKSVIAEAPAPSEIGGFAFRTEADFNAALMNAGGTLAQINLQGQSGASDGNVWTALGINRINRVGWENRLGPSDGSPYGSTQVSFGPTWITSGTTWTRLAQNPASCFGSWTTTFANPAVTFGKVVWSCNSGPTFTQNLTVTPDGLLSQTTCSGCPSTWGMTFPALTNDGTTSPNVWGATTTTTSAAGGIVSATWPASGDQQNYIAISSNPSCLTSEAAVTSPFGDLTPVRATTGTGAGCATSDATQTSFVYPRKNSGPSAASVQSGMTITGTNTYSNSALQSSVVSGGSGTYYIGPLAAGGWAQSIIVNGSTESFSAPCNFIMTVSGGTITSIEVDRNVTVTIPNGAHGSHTNLSLTAYMPVTGL